MKVRLTLQSKKNYFEVNSLTAKVTDDWSEFKEGRHLNIYRDSKILRSDSVAAESIIVKLLNLNG